MSLWWVILGMGAVSLALRGSFLLLPNRRPPGWLADGLALVPAAVLSAIVGPELLVSGGRPNVGPDNLRLWAGLLAVAVAWRTRSVPLTLGVGMAALWLLQALRT